MHKLESTGLSQQQPSTQKRQQPNSAGTTEQPAEPRLVPVVVTQTSSSSALELSRHIFELVIGPIGTLGIILVVVLFALLQKEDLRDRLIRLFGSGDLHRTTVAMDDAGGWLTRHFLI
jgi:predicted PurR-regulated permease PerM